MSDEVKKKDEARKKISPMVALGVALGLAVLAAIVAFVVGRVRAPEKPDTRSPLEKRMSDPKYVAAIEALRAEQKLLMRDLQALRMKIKVAEEKDPEGKGDEAQRLKKEELELAKKFEANRQNSMALVRSRMLRDTDLKGSKKKETK
ncbi:MAG: hypothetical protein J5807_03565 [Kiritimatiellae bacterium]|nr:hypothetical protein [Kiritimatiellia bacterium]